MNNKEKFEQLASNAMREVLKDPVSRAVATSGRPRSIEATDDMATYYAIHPNAGPLRQLKIITGTGFSIEPIVKTLQSDWILIGIREIYNSEEKKQWSSFQTWVSPEGGCVYLDCAMAGNKSSYGRGEVLFFYDDDDAKSNLAGASIESITYLAPIGQWESHHSMIEKLKQIAFENPVSIDKSAKLGMISHDGSDYYVKTFSLEGKTPQFLFPDLHYGSGFEDFHNSLLSRLGEESKGLVLLHGEPGTGKTQYIRVLLEKLGALGKSVLYAPPNFSSQLTDPGMIEFISNWIIDEKRDCILLIEDAEPLLEIRQGADGRTTGISNLLNITDGLLNDILGLMVIATFNTEISRIDPALLRPQRLIARKEFCKISELHGLELSQALQVPMPEIDYPATLAEFYAADQGKRVLIHTVKPTKKSIGF